MPDVELTKQFVRDYVDRRMPPDLEAPVSVSDLVQSVMVLVFRNRHAFRGKTEEEFCGWLARIAERKIIDSRRRYRKRRCPDKLRSEYFPKPDEKIDERCPARLVASTEEHHQLIRAIETLPIDIQTIVMLRYREGKTFEEVAQQCCIPTTTCRRRWVTGLRLLAKALVAKQHDHCAT